ncbi:MAG: hypothetical protein IJ174_00670 [Clostridia bacterium]|nr:hypothetical protein [Clostridia bacterium]
MKHTHRFQRLLSLVLMLALALSAVSASAADLRKLSYNYTYFTIEQGGFVVPLPSDTEFEEITEWMMSHNIIVVGGTQSYTVIIRRYANVTYDKMCARLLSNAAYKCKAYKTNDTPRMVATALNPQPDTAAVMVCLEGQDGVAYVVELLSGASDNVGKDAKLWSVAEEVTYCISSGHTGEGAKIKVKQ